MTDRTEIERLLNATGKTLEGLPTQKGYLYSGSYEAKEQKISEMMSSAGFTLSIPYIMHQSDVIELLIGALRDALAKQPKWISVEERLPEAYQHVIVHVKHTPKYDAGWHAVEQDCWFGDGWECNADEEVHLVTHWMPLPEPPEG